MKKRLVSSIENVNLTYEQEVEAETEEEAIEKAEDGDWGEVVDTDFIEREDVIAEEIPQEDCHHCGKESCPSCNNI
ncbi:MAG: hypothetical protein WC827_04725 [Candidatus Paceibacterota bacterium]|jgi:hypothetical protein